MSVVGHGDVKLEIYDVHGRLVNILSAGGEGQTIPSVSWNGISRAGKPVSPGVYFVRLGGNPNSVSRKVVRR